MEECGTMFKKEINGNFKDIYFSTKSIQKAHILRAREELLWKVN